jgi:hypothetical protein
MPPLPPPPDVSAVAEPPALVITGRVGKLGASLAVLHDWTSLPMPQSEQISEILGGGALGPVVDLDQPIDLAVSMVGKDDSISGLVAVAAAVRDPEGAKALVAEKFKLVAGVNGTIALRPVPPQPNGSGDDGKADDDRHPCELAPAAGAAPMRLVCGLDEASLTALGPWLTRTAPRNNGGADAHVEMRLAPLKKTIADEWRKFQGLFEMMSDSQAGTAALRDVAQAGLRDLALFVDDLEGVAIDVDLSDAAATMTTTLKIPGATSSFSRLLLANADKNGPPPATFWQMPADADVGFFTRGHDDNDYVHGRDLVLRVVADALATEGITERDRHAIVDALTALATPAPMAYASGVDTAAIARALAAKRTLGDAADPVERAEAGRVTAEAFLGWRILETDVPAAGITDAVKSLAAVWARPAVQALYRTKVKMPAPSLRIAPMPVSKTPWPAGTTHFVVEAFVPTFQPARGGKAKNAAPAKPFVVHLVVVPDGPRAWMGLGGDLALVASKVTGAVAGTGATLRSRAELNDMADANLGSAGFMTSRAFAEIVSEGVSLGSEDTSTADSFFDDVAQLPHQGDPIEFSMTARQGKAPSSSAVLRVSKGTIQSAVASILRHGGF